MIASRWFLLGAFAVAISGCGGGGGSASGIDAGPGGDGAGCEGPAAPAMCGTSCSGGGACGSGTYCGADQVCTADCTPTGNECGAGRVCGADGRCQTDTSNRVDAAPIDCPSVEVTTQPIIPTVQILIDHSGTMDAFFDNNNTIRRFESVRNALLDPNNGVIAGLQSQVRFGAALYTAFDDSNDPAKNALPCPHLPAAVAPALDNYGAIDAALRPLLTRANLGEDTPTGESLERVAASFPAPGPNDKQIIVLATDGLPDTCDDPDPQDSPDPARQEAANQATEDIAQAIHDQTGIDIIILSVGDDVTETHLQRMANIGVGKAAGEAVDPAPFYVANNPDELAAAFGDIIGGARECKFTVDNGRVTDPSGGTVELNGSPLEYQTDWDMLDETTMEIKGAACDTYLNADVAVLTAEFPCGAVIIVE